jgi:ketosteroid isomerase-like protein
MNNRELIRHVYTEASKGNGQPLLDALHDDIVWTIIGTTGLSGVHRGKQAVIANLLGPLRARLSTPVKFTIRRVISDGDWVVLVADGEATTITGRPYNNSYCIVGRIEDGRFVEMTDYIDTELITNSLLASA